ncbi:Olfactory receptor 2G6 [Heterocephalus glaber]|uniref:Olfactory receptor 2G6 n=1 Tax=Heterocephalus glaber TaxID=10181 RepID=G5C858_HETGA|nr:Olfactory receptor 2G6 [Heterocephalus glaber]
MERENVSFPNTFVLLGFSEFLWLERPLFAVVLVSYILTLVGNSSLITLSLVGPRLQMPMYFFLDYFSLKACTECVLLAMMAIDGYVAICWPLQYTLMMHPSVSMKMEAASWFSGLVNFLLQATLTLQVPLCGEHTLDHFFHDIPVLIKLACEDTTANDLALTIGGI